MLKNFQISFNTSCIGNMCLVDHSYKTAKIRSISWLSLLYYSMTFMPIHQRKIWIAGLLSKAYVLNPTITSLAYAPNWSRSRYFPSDYLNSQKWQGLTTTKELFGHSYITAWDIPAESYEVT